MTALEHRDDTSNGARRQLADLAKPFPRDLVERDPGGNSYAAHDTVTQFLLGIVGPFSFELVEIIRGDVPGAAPDPQGRSKRAKDGTPALRQVIVGGVWRLCLQVDGRPVRLEEAGDVEDPHNWRHDGQRLKQAASDAIKRCAMRAGLGLHLWAGERYVLGERLASLEPAPAETTDDELDAAAVPAEQTIRVLGSAAAAKELVSREIVSDRFRQALKAAQVDLFGETWEDFWRHANLHNWVELLLAAREQVSPRQLTDRSGAGAAGGPPDGEPAPAASSDPAESSPSAAPGDPSGEGVSPPAPSPAYLSEAAAVPATAASHTRGAASDTNASAAGAGDTDVGRTAGQSPPAPEAQTAEAAAATPEERDPGAGDGGGDASAAVSTDLRGVGPVTAWCLRRELSPGTVRLYLARHHPGEFGRQGTWPLANIQDLDALRDQAADRAVELAAKQFPKAGEPRGWEGGS